MNDIADTAEPFITVYPQESGELVIFVYSDGKVTLSIGGADYEPEPIMVRAFCDQHDEGFDVYLAGMVFRVEKRCWWVCSTCYAAEEQNLRWLEAVL